MQHHNPYQSDSGDDELANEIAVGHPGYGSEEEPGEISGVCP